MVDWLGSEGDGRDADTVQSIGEEIVEMLHKRLFPMSTANSPAPIDKSFDHLFN